MHACMHEVDSFYLMVFTVCVANINNLIFFSESATKLSIVALDTVSVFPGAQEKKIL